MILLFIILILIIIIIISIKPNGKKYGGEIICLNDDYDIYSCKIKNDNEIINFKIEIRGSIKTLNKNDLNTNFFQKTDKSIPFFKKLFNYQYKNIFMLNDEESLKKLNENKLIKNLNLKCPVYLIKNSIDDTGMAVDVDEDEDGDDIYDDYIIATKSEYYAIFYQNDEFIDDIYSFVPANYEYESKKNIINNIPLFYIEINQKYGEKYYIFYSKSKDSLNELRQLNPDKIKLLFPIVPSIVPPIISTIVPPIVPPIISTFVPPIVPPIISTFIESPSGIKKRKKTKKKKKKKKRKKKKTR
jgi:hypothetical protein